MAAKSDSRAEADPYLRIIAFFKLIKATLFLAAGFGVLNLFHKDVADKVQHLLDRLHVDPENKYAKLLLEDVGKWTNTDLKIFGLSLIAFFYAGLFGTEGVGLFLRKRWAEWFVVVVTSTLLPLEIYEIIHKFHAWKLGVMAVNIAIIAYLVVVIRRKKAK